jgi:hypothetical protein
VLRKLRPLMLSAALATPLFSLPACGDNDVVDSGDPDAPDLLAGADFVAIPREVSRTEAAARERELEEAGTPTARLRAAPASTSFYLAIKKSSLSERWFLSAFLQQWFPGQVSWGAATSLGTRVVSFKIQNDKLFVFDADDRHTSSSVFDPDVLVEAYPLVDAPNLPGAGQYVFIDPSAGLNRFDLLSDWFGTNPWPIRFETELSFMQNFRQLADGATYEQVFTGYADQPIVDDPIEANTFRGSGTLGIALRRYKEGSHYQEVELPWQEHFFRSEPKLVPNGGGIRQTAAHWDIHPGMQPIEWVISPALVELDNTPAYADADLVGAVKAGVESWNTAFGFQAFRARVATANESFSQDDKNYIIFDPDPTLGFAFANWRTNPNTGEIRGASVYFGGAWVDRAGFEDDPAGTGGSNTAPARPTAAARPKLAALQWGGVKSDPLCVLHADEIRDQLRPGMDESNLTAGQKLEKYLANMIVHEIGHDLGLRHNFKGTLIDAPPGSSSVMDYTDFETRVAQGTALGTYDVDAVRYLYGLSPDLPAQPFCTDDAVGFDPDCQRFDTGADPFAATWQPRWELLRDFFVRYGVDASYLEYFTTYSSGVLDYANNGDFAQSNRALDTMLDQVAAPLDPALLADPTFFASGADMVMAEVLRLQGAAPNPAIAARIDEQLVAVLENVDGVRSYASRRLTVDILKGRQTVEALGALLDAKASIEAQLVSGSLSPTEATQSRDLLARINRATQPYFD